MKIGILSDTHNNLTNLQSALALFRKEGVKELVHCGDITSQETAAALGDFRVIHTAGNGDYATGEIRQILLGLNPQSYSGLVYTGDIQGVKIAVTHGHLNGKVQELLNSGEFAYVFTGHSHRRKDILVGPTRLVNPGSLGGLKFEERSVFILDLASFEGMFHIIE